MKRIGNIYEKINSLANLPRRQTAKVNRARPVNTACLSTIRIAKAICWSSRICFASKSYRTSTYDIFTVHGASASASYRLPYFPDRIAHHAIMNVLEPLFVDTFTADTYSCIKKRGIHQTAPES